MYIDYGNIYSDERTVCTLRLHSLNGTSIFQLLFAVRMAAQSEILRPFCPIIFRDYSARGHWNQFVIGINRDKRMKYMCQRKCWYKYILNGVFVDICRPFFVRVSLFFFNSFMKNANIDNFNNNLVTVSSWQTILEFYHIQG